MLLVFVPFWLLLIKIALTDIKSRTVEHSDLLCLAVLLLVTWYWNVNVSVLLYSFLFLCVGFLLFCFKLIGAGDVKLLVVLTLAISPQFLSLFAYGSVLLGGVLALIYLIYGLLTDLQRVRKRGIPYTIPIVIMGAFLVPVSVVAN